MNRASTEEDRCFFGDRCHEDFQLYDIGKDVVITVCSWHRSCDMRSGAFGNREPFIIRARNEALHRTLNALGGWFAQAKEKTES